MKLNHLKFADNEKELLLDQPYNIRNEVISNPPSRTL